MLAVLGFLGLSDIHAANGLKNFFAMCINGVAAGYFIVRGAVNWPAALVLIAGADRRRLRGRALRPVDRAGRARGARSSCIGLAVAVLLFLMR